MVPAGSLACPPDTAGPPLSPRAGIQGWRSCPEPAASRRQIQQIVGPPLANVPIVPNGVGDLVPNSKTMIIKMKCPEPILTSHLTCPDLVPDHGDAGQLDLRADGGLGLPKPLLQVYQQRLIALYLRNPLAPLSEVTLDLGVFGFCLSVEGDQSGPAGSQPR